MTRVRNTTARSVVPALLVLCLGIASPLLAQGPNVVNPVMTNASGLQAPQYNPNVLTVTAPAGPVASLGPPGVAAILYAPSNGDDPAYRAAIGALTGAVVDYFDAGAATPDLLTLQNYDVVYTWANFAYNDAVLFGDNLAAYVDGGGRVILGAFCTYTSGNSLDGLIMTPAYCPVVSPAGTNLFADSSYVGDGITEIHIGGSFVQDYSCQFRDDLVVQGTGAIDGTYADGAVACAYRDDFAVIYTNGTGDAGLGCLGQWPELIANAAVATSTPPSCIPITGLVATNDCPNVTLDWINNPPSGSTYEEIRIYRDGTLIDTVAGTSTFYTDFDPAGGVPTTIEYTVEAVCDVAGGAVAFGGSTALVSCPTVRILYAPSEADDPAYRDAIALATQGVVDYFDTRADTPDIGFLTANYDVVYAWVNFGLFDAVATGDVLAEFADAGGTVILGAFCTYTSGNSMAGQIMSTCYSPVTSPAGTNLFATSDYQGDGITCMYNTGLVTTLESVFRDDIVAQGNGVIDGTYFDGVPTGAYNQSGPNVFYTNGSGAAALGGLGQWPEYIAATVLCPVAPPGCGPVTDLVLDPDCDASEVSLSWMGGAFDAIEIEVNGVLEASLAGSATSYLYAAPGDGNYTFVVRPVCAGVPGCSASATTGLSSSAPKHIVLGFETVAGQIDSVLALTTALEAIGELDFMVYTTLADVPKCGDAPDPNSTIWAMTGTFPANFALDEETGSFLCAHIAAGGGVYFEGGDTWGFDGPTSFTTCDGVADGALDGDDSFLSMVGSPGGPFEDPIWTAAYNQDQPGTDWTDRIQPANEGGTSVLTWDEGTGLGYSTGIWQDGDPGVGSVVAQSWEFGGYDGDQIALVTELLTLLESTPTGDLFVRGDANSDSSIDVSDAVFALAALFVPGSPGPACPDAADCNDDGGFDVSDAVYLLGALFVPGSPQVVAPFPDCGEDPTADSLDCPGGSPFCP